MREMPGMEMKAPMGGEALALPYERLMRNRSPGKYRSNWQHISKFAYLQLCPFELLYKS